MIRSSGRHKYKDENMSEDNDYSDFMKDDIQIMPDERHPAIKQIESYYSTISKLALQSKEIIVDDIKNYRNALDLSVEAKNIYKIIEEYRKKAIEPSRKTIQMVNNCAKDLQASLEMIEATIKVKLASFQQIREIEAQKAQESIKKLSESLGIDFSIIAPKEAKNISSAYASTVTKESVEFVIIDETLVPDEYWLIDEKAIQKHIDLGKRNIPGIQVVFKKNFIIRKK